MLQLLCNVANRSYRDTTRSEKIEVIVCNHACECCVGVRHSYMPLMQSEVLVLQSLFPLCMFAILWINGTLFLVNPEFCRTLEGLQKFLEMFVAYNSDHYAPIVMQCCQIVVIAISVIVQWSRMIIILINHKHF